MTLRRINLDTIPGFTSTFVGFDSLFDRLTDNSSSYPPYDIEKLSETEYRITLAVAGFTNEQLNVSSADGQLTVSGSKVKEDVEATDQGIQVIHRGIATRSFERAFTLNEYVEISDVSLKDGLLVIQLVRNIPESAKAKKYEIGSR